jgi:acyl-CoA thioesterase-1
MLNKNYHSGFSAIYERLAERHQIPLYPNMLKGIQRNMFLKDGIHPNADGHAYMGRQIYAFLKPQLVPKKPKRRFWLF